MKAKIRNENENEKLRGKMSLKIPSTELERMKSGRRAKGFL